MRTKMFALAVVAMGLIAGGTALALTLRRTKAQVDNPPAATEAQALKADGCCVTGDCCCPGEGACCDPVLKAKAKAATTRVKKGAGCCVTGDCCCPGQGSCCADLTKVDAKACCATEAEKKGSCCDK
jgi:hypothetical protein